MKYTYIRCQVSKAPASVVKFAVFGNSTDPNYNFTYIEERLQALIDGNEDETCFSWRTPNDARTNKPDYFAIAKLPLAPHLDEFMP